jgi:hypothetical protein
MAHYQHIGANSLEQLMVHRLRIPIVAVAIASACATAMMPAARADVGEYLKALQPKYVYLTPEQLLTEGYKACEAGKRGVPGTDTITTVQHDLSVSVAAAYDIVTTAVVRLEC